MDGARAGGRVRSEGADFVDGRRVALVPGSAPAERAIERIECPVEVVREQFAEPPAVLQHRPGNGAKSTKPNAVDS